MELGKGRKVDLREGKKSRDAAGQGVGGGGKGKKEWKKKEVRN